MRRDTGVNMWGMASELRRLFFETDGAQGDVELKLKEPTGVEMSMTEGSQTKADRRLTKKRVDINHGEPHGYNSARKAAMR